MAVDADMAWIAARGQTSRAKRDKGPVLLFPLLMFYVMWSGAAAELCVTRGEGGPRAEVAIYTQPHPGPPLPPPPVACGQALVRMILSGPKFRGFTTFNLIYQVLISCCSFDISARGESCLLKTVA